MAESYFHGLFEFLELLGCKLEGGESSGSSALVLIELSSREVSVGGYPLLYTQVNQGNSERNE